jgi:MiaB-like tRNA modifying enzyme
MKVLVEAYGCTLNRGEAEEFEDGLLAMGHQLARSPEDAGAIVIFTCGVIETTERHMLKRISEMSQLAGKKLIVCGCLPNISPARILKAAPHAYMFDTAGHMAALNLFHEDANPTPAAPTSDAVGILPLATGCDGACTYCVTKNARGPLRSRPPGKLADRMKELVGRGCAEIQLCAQDTAIYGTDIGEGMHSLVEVLSRIEGNYMMRIGMMNPASLLLRKESVLQAFEHPKVFKFLHLPVQSGSDSVLARMNRRHNALEFEELVAELSTRFPRMSLSTDIIVGFPGETDRDFDLSLRIVNKMKPDIINITRFSSRPGTEAHRMKDKVPSRIAKDRSRILTELRFSLTETNYDAFKNQTMLALATERRVEGTTFLRTTEYKPVVVAGNLELGRWYNVTITERERTHLCGEIEN